VVGVRGARNLLQVVPEKSEKRVADSDKDTMKRASEALKKDAYPKDSHVMGKSIDNGAVPLSGEAHTFSDHLRAVMLIDRLPGVTRVASKITGPDSFGEDERLSQDDEIGKDLALALKDREEFKEVSTSVKNGVVQLTGTVGSAWVELSAVRLVRQVTGVKSVDDQLKIDEMVVTER
jgi:osmotically-inducible protein OsmY